ncbi:MAG: alpha-N-acetylglucosaminidase [Bacteroidaceae bacterium]
MKKNLKKLFLVMACWLTTAVGFAVTENPQVVGDLLNRIGGAGAASLFETEIDETLHRNGKEVFVITSKNGKPCIKGSTTLALTTGLNWYLNHTAYVNLSWSKLTTNLSAVTLPVPTAAETHVANADYRYYLNYCTFSYSMAVWTWDRWQKEIDWMALHGINMPLQIVGADVVWKNVLTELGYTSKEVNQFIAGPAFQAWWLMNNQEGWGGENPDWWYARQEQLSKNIMVRMRELGMKPVLPGYSGMVPSNAKQKLGWNVADPGTWCNFQRPGFLQPTDVNFSRMAKLYYKHLTALMGTSTYYSMDPFHEGGNTDGVDLNATFRSIYNEMNTASAGSKWVIQNWGSNPRGECLNVVPKGKLIVLDLFAEATPHWNSWNGFGGHEMVYCMLHNFGGRVGLHGRLNKTINGYYEALAAYPATMKGVGATPEGIETNPMLYDALFELPWRTSCNSELWMKDYAAARYGIGFNQNAYDAWDELAKSVYNCKTEQQGTTEPVICARPRMTVNSVSTWSTSSIYWKTEKVRRAVTLMLASKNELSQSDNYAYDLVDFTRQAITDYANGLLKQIDEKYKINSTDKYTRMKDRYLQLILDQDQLLNTVPAFMVGTWTESAKAVTNEATGTTTADKNWMEQNARTQISVWGTEGAANGGGLHDYSNREWGGILKDLHYARWKKFFDLKTKKQPEPSSSEWYAMENAWAHNHTAYPVTAQGQAVEVVQTMFDKYFGILSYDANKSYVYAYKSIDDKSDTLFVKAYRGSTYTCTATVPQAASKALLYVDLNGNNQYEADETFVGSGEGTTRTFHVAIPMNAAVGRVKALFVEDEANGTASADERTQTFGTNLSFALMLRDLVTTPRSVSITTPDAKQGTAVIVGSDLKKVTSKEDVVVKATAGTGYNFLNWTDQKGNIVSMENPYTYMGKNEMELTANFVVNKWKTPEQDNKEMATIQSFGQFINTFSITKKGMKAQTFYEASECPATLFNIIPTVVNVARGSGFSLSWTNTQNGLNYCRLSAYIDTNNDGDFNDKGELLEVRGDKESPDNASVSNGSLQILLPINIPAGVTRIRMRYDGAWSGNWDATTGAAPADSKTLRMVYDIQLNVTDLPSTPPTIQVATNNAAMGTVDINGMGNPSTVTIGSTVILQAQPSTGYSFDKWVDQYGRTVSTNQNYSFIPTESGLFTAYFKKALPKTLDLGTYAFPYTLEGTHLTLGKPTKGSGELVIPATYAINGVTYSITGLEAGALVENKELTSITLGTNLVDLGDNVCANTNWNGNGAKGSFTATKGIANGKAWRITAAVNNGGATYNNWGSSLLATGVDPLADNYANGFQLYLAKDGSLTVKCGTTSTAFQNVAGSKTFEVEMLNNGNGLLSIVTTAVNGTKERHEFTSFTCDSLFQFCYALPTGVNMNHFMMYESQVGEDELCGGVAPFKGCTNLSKITASIQNDAFTASARSTYNVLYNKSRTKLICFPSAKEVRQFSIPASVQEIANRAFNGVTKLERLVPATDTPLAINATVFKDCKALCVVNATSAAAYHKAWALPLLIRVDNDLNTTINAPVKVIETLASEDKVGEVTANITPTYSWLTRTFSSENVYTPVYLMHNVDSVVVSSSDVETAATTQALRIGTDLIVYGFNGTSFAIKSTGKSLLAGAYLMKPASSYLSKKITFVANAITDTPATSGVVFTGNGALSTKSVSGNIYLYDNLANVFTPQSTSVNIAPYQAYMKVYGTTLPAQIAGVPTTGIHSVGADGKGILVEGNRIKVIGYSSYAIYNTAGVAQPENEALQPGNYIIHLPMSTVKVNIP